MPRGGVVSGLGKGITAASLGRLLKNRGYKVVNQKFDPYINVDPGTMSPYEHGEVFVTEDGAETDLDLGHYERFTDENLSKNSSITMGKIYSQVLERERRGDYLGKTVQVIPHITNAIKEKIYAFEDTDVDIVISELGGTVGDIEGLSLIEAIRQVGIEKEEDDVLYIHVTLLPYIHGSNELKSKPTQHSVKELQSFGVKPDILVCRSETEIPDNLREKMALFCNVRKENIIANRTAGCLYEVPLMLEKEGLAMQVCKHLHLEKREPNNQTWEEMIEKINHVSDKKVRIAIVGKYVKLEDSYLSVAESVRHASFENGVKAEILYIDSEEFNPKCKNPVIHIMEYQKEVVKKGGTMRLGSYPCMIKEGTLAEKIYQTTNIKERHRHRFEYNNDYREQMEKAGLTISGTSPDGTLVEMIEIKEHPFFIAGQFHPEFKSRPDKPAPLFVGLVNAASQKNK